MGRPYTGWNGNSDRRRPGLEKLVDLIEEHFGLWNNGTWSSSYRNKRGKRTPSVHNTGRAADLSWRGAPHRGSGNYDDAHRFMEFITRSDVADNLGIEAVYDYWPHYGPHGRGWKCDRNAWTIYGEKAFAGVPGDWVHIEISEDHCDDPDYINHWFLHLIGDLKIERPVAQPQPEQPAETKIEPYPGSPVRRGARGRIAKMVQEKVGATPDGWFGPKTEQAVREWQANNRDPKNNRPLHVDGIVGPVTWRAMFQG